jgi:hypothetical protein
MTDTEYNKIVLDSIQKLRLLIDQREEIELEISKIRQFARAALRMLADDERQQMEKLLDAVNSSDNLSRVGLADAIRNVLEDSPKRWFTVAQVRDVLCDTGFDFSRYTSNPLSSVSTTLKRFKSPDIESTEIDDVTAYRWKDTKAARKRKAERADMDALVEYLTSKANPDKERTVERDKEE